MTDVEEKKTALENEERETRRWLNHPLATSFLADLESEETKAISLICDQPVVNLETFFAHFELVGFLRAVRYSKRRLSERADEIETELKELQ